jgi:hypothetical protein
MAESVHCLYCDSLQPGGIENCRQCGMPLPTKSPKSRQPLIRLFQRFFWLIVIFCLIMMFYLPRHFFS